MELANLVDVDVVDPGALGRHCRPTNLVTVCHCVFACCPLDMDIAVLAGHWPAIGCWPKLLMTCKAGLNGNNERQFLLHQLLLGNKTPFFSLSMLTTPDGHRALFFFYSLLTSRPTRNGHHMPPSAECGGPLPPPPS